MNTVTVRQRGEITLPKKVRDTCHVVPGTMLSIVPIGKVIVLIPDYSRVDEAAGGLRSKPLSEANIIRTTSRIRRINSRTDDGRFR